MNVLPNQSQFAKKCRATGNHLLAASVKGIVGRGRLTLARWGGKPLEEKEEGPIKSSLSIVSRSASP